VALEVPDEIAPLDHPIAAGAKSVIIWLLVGSMPTLAPYTIPLSIVYEPVEDGWVQARIDELPAVITAAPTRTEVKAMVLDALREYLLSLRDVPPAHAAGEDREAVALQIAG
jgi:predicted RNase H-like HicB family nuclease